MRRHRGLRARITYGAVAVTLLGGLGITAPAVAQNGNGDGETPVDELPWMDTSLAPEERATLLIEAMSEEQKIDQIAMELDETEHGADEPGPGANEDISDENFTCEWYTVGRHLEGMQEFGIPSIRMINGPSGGGGGDCEEDPPATGLPSGIGVAASFDRDHAYAWGDMAGAEVRANAHAVFLAPGVNMGRVAHAGRNFEYFGEDPYLSGVMGVEEILGIQDNDVHANVKHYAFNEQETERRSMNVVVPPRAAHEIYLLPFEMAAKDADVASMMCSFPRIHGTYACENPELLTEIARERWDWHGYFLSDRRATMSTIDSINAGFDLAFPRKVMFTEPGIRAALEGNLEDAEGRSTWDQIEQMLHRRVHHMSKFGLVDNPITGSMHPDDRADLLADHAERARAIAEDSMVLMKNDDGVLPLDADELDSIAVIGADYFAGNAKFGPNSPNIFSTVNALEEHIVEPVEGLENTLAALDSDATVDLFTVGGEYVDPRDDDEEVQWGGGEYSYEEALEAVNEGDYDAVIVMVGDLSVEGSDRDTAALPGPEDYGHGRESQVINFEQVDLVRDVAAENDNTVVVLKNGGPITTEWRDDVPAILQAWYPGQSDGDAVANALFGVVNPGGKLPMTFPLSEREAAFETESQFPGVPTDEFAPVPGDPDFGDESGEVLESTYSEDLEMGYRWYEANGVESPFPFGFGLSYTTFEYSDLSVESSEDSSPTRGLDVTFTITNTGDRAGAEAAQVYLTLPDEAGQPAKRLVGFEKVQLDAGEARTVTVTIDHDAAHKPFSYFAPEEGGSWEEGEWRTADGEYTVHVGTSSADTALEETLDLDLPEAPSAPGEGQEGDIPVEATIPGRGDGEPGSLTLTIREFGDAVDLGEGERTQEGYYRFDGDLPSVVVTDTRNDNQAGDTGWSVSGVANDFVNNGDSFDAGHLGWIPWTTAQDRPGVEPGPRVNPIARNGPGLAEPQTLVSATSEGRLGAATAGAHLFMLVPLDTAPGDYRSAINLSLFPVD